MSCLYLGHCSRWCLFTQTPSHTHTHKGYPCTLAHTCSHPACIAQRCHFFGVGMQSWKDYFCKPCSASVTSPQEDMEYRMGSCIGVARSQVTPHLSDTAHRMAWQNETRMSGKTSVVVSAGRKGDEGEYLCRLGWRQGDIKEKACIFGCLVSYWPVVVGALEIKRVKGDGNGREKSGGGAKRSLTISVQCERGKEWQTWINGRH